MNTEIFDYLKALSQKDGFVINALNTMLSAVILIAGFLSVRYGATMLLYAIMFGCATGILMLNSYRRFRQKNKIAWVFAAMAICFGAVTAIAIRALMGGAQ